jgi:hypothetical protein
VKFSFRWVPIRPQNAVGAVTPESRERAPTASQQYAGSQSALAGWPAIWARRTVPEAHVRLTGPGYQPLPGPQRRAGSCPRVGA